MKSRVPAPERIEVERRPDLPGIEVLRGENTCRKYNVFHEQYAISSVLRSSGDWLYRNRTWYMRPGELSLMEPGEVHSNLQTYGISQFRVVFVKPEEMSNIATEMGLRNLRPHLKTCQVGNPKLFTAFQKFHKALESPNTTSLECQTHLAAALRGYMETCFETPLEEHRPRRSHAGVQRARRLLEDSFAENISLDVLAQTAGVSRFHLVRLFVRDVGIPPHEFQVQLRIARAKEMLGNGLPIAQVAAETGFTDQSHLTRHMKRLWGYTPAAYQRG